MNNDVMFVGWNQEQPKHEVTPCFLSTEIQSKSFANLSIQIMAKFLNDNRERLVVNTPIGVFSMRHCIYMQKDDAMLVHCEIPSAFPIDENWKWAMATMNSVAEPTFSDAIKMAKGCFDYSGGHHHDGHLEAYHHGIQTVLNVLEAVAKNGFDLQSSTLHHIGSIQESDPVKDAE